MVSIPNECRSEFDCRGFTDGTLTRPWQVIGWFWVCG